MEYLAKITHKQKLENSPLWKYTFLDVENNQSHLFYHYEPIKYTPNLVGKLNLTKDNFLLSFKQEIANENKKFKRLGILTKLEGKVRWNYRNFTNSYYPKKQIHLSPQKLYELHAQGFTWKEMAFAYGKNERTIYRWLEPRNEPLQKRGIKPIITDEVASLVRSYALENTTKTQQEITDYICKELNIKISRPSITILLKKIGITRKKFTRHYNQLNEEKAKAFNEGIKPLLSELPFIALDECSFYPNSDPRFGYSLKGERAISKIPSHKGKHSTLLFAISNLKVGGVVHWKLVEDKVDYKVFYDFLEELKPIRDKKNILLMDNAPIHAAPKIRKKKGLPNIKEQMAKKNMEVRFITPYAPMLNPAELCFNLLRQQTEKQKPRSYEEMKKAIEKVVELLNQKDLSEYFRHCVEYFDKKKATIELKITDI